MSAERRAAFGVAGDPDAEQDGAAAGGRRQQGSAARLIRARGLVAAASHAQIAADIAAGCGSSMIRAYRLALGIALADVVAQVRARYEADGRGLPKFSETLLSAYETGQKRPGPEYLHYLCATYQADPADLGFDGCCRCGASHRPPGVPAPRTAVAGETGQPLPAAGQVGPPPAGQAGPPPAGQGDPCAPPQPGGRQLTCAGDDDADELRRMLLRQMTAASCRADGRFLGAADRIRRRLDDALAGGTVSAAMIDTWEHAAAGYGRQYMTVPPLRLLCDVLLDLADVRRMCEERQPPEFSERLCRLASQLTGLAGITMLDLGDHRLARSFFRTARTAADETGDRRLRAWVLAREALVPLYYGDPAEAAAMAGGAADLAGRHLCAAAVMAPVIEARAQSRLAAANPGPRREPLNRVMAALDKAAEAIGDLPAEHRADTALGYTERQLYFHAGDALVGLGDWQGAHRAFGLAAQLYPATEVLDCALVAFGQARCLLESAEPGLALALGRDTVLGLPPEHRTDVILRVARQLGQAAGDQAGCPGPLAEYRDALAAAG